MSEIIIHTKQSDEEVAYLEALAKERGVIDAGTSKTSPLSQALPHKPSENSIDAGTSRVLLFTFSAAKRT